MRKNLLSWLAAGALALGFGFSLAQPGMQFTGQSLSADAKAAVLEALTGLNGEYANYATYTAVIEKFGNVEPYVSIRAAETRHILALQRALSRYREAIPANTYLGKVTVPADLAAVASAGVQSEKDNVALYDKLLPRVAAYPDLRMVFNNLRSASLNQHLPTFEAALKNGGKLDYGPWGMTGPRGGMGYGAGPGNRQGNGQGYGPGSGNATGAGCACGMNTPMGRGPRR